MWCAQDVRVVTRHDVAKATVLNKWRAIQVTAGADGGVALEVGVGTDHCIPSNCDSLVDVDGIGVFQSNACSHPVTAQVGLARLFHLGQLLSGIDARDLAGICSQDCLGWYPGDDSLCDNISEVVFALGVGWLQPLQCREQKIRLHTVDAGVDLLYCAFPSRGIACLNDFEYLFRACAYDPAVVSRVVELSGQHGQRCLLGAVVLHEASQRGGGEKRCVTADEQHIPVKAGEMSLCRPHGVAGAALFPLQGKRNTVSAAGLPDLLSLMADHGDETVGVQTLRRMYDIGEQGFTCKQVEHFGPG